MTPPPSTSLPRSRSDSSLARAASNACSSSWRVGCGCSETMTVLLLRLSYERSLEYRESQRVPSAGIRERHRRHRSAISKGVRALSRDSRVCRRQRPVVSIIPMRGPARVVRLFCSNNRWGGAPKPRPAPFRASAPLADLLSSSRSSCQRLKPATRASPIHVTKVDIYPLEMSAWSASPSQSMLPVTN